uniref:Uncharacterized protein n=2 Tax=Canis lupus familiaris TaxID=9615 RepID=A0A8C0SP31_CANLF
MARVTRKPVETTAVMHQPTLRAKQLTPRAKTKKTRKSDCRPKSVDSSKAKKIQKGIKGLLHGNSKKKSSHTSTTIPRKVKRVKKAKKFRPLTKMD